MSARPPPAEGRNRCIELYVKKSPVGITPTPLDAVSAPEHLKALAGEIAVGGKKKKKKKKRV